MKGSDVANAGICVAAQSLVLKLLFNFYPPEVLADIRTMLFRAFRVACITIVLMFRLDGSLTG
jgi:hypothetical protein